MVLKLNEFRDKLAGCWAGKNVGGVLGAPFECKRMVPDVDFYIQDLSMGPPANDDLDLQIVWLAAVERYGRNVNASILGEYWLSYVIPNWVEYGTLRQELFRLCVVMLTILIRTAMAAGSVLSFGRAWHLDIRKLQPDMHLRMQLSIMQTRECMVKFSQLRFRVRHLQKVTVRN